MRGWRIFLAPARSHAARRPRQGCAALELGCEQLRASASSRSAGQRDLDFDEELHARERTPPTRDRERIDDGHSDLQGRDADLPEDESSSGRPAGPRDQGCRVPRARRTVGVRQDDQPAHARRPRGRRRGNDPDRRRRRGERASEEPRHRDGVPELRALSAHGRGREHGLRAEDRATFRSPRSTRACARPRRSSISRSTSSASRVSSPAASASASRWAARSCASPASSSWTSRCRTSTRSCASRPAARSRRSSAGSA